MDARRAWFFFSFDGDFETEGVPEIAGGDDRRAYLMGDFDGDSIGLGYCSGTLSLRWKKRPLCENPVLVGHWPFEECSK